MHPVKVQTQRATSVPATRDILTWVKKATEDISDTWGGGLKPSGHLLKGDGEIIRDKSECKKGREERTFKG